ncbi:uncharacterized protein [Palaemon carinicauda]|uniref:uncharacterized protein n=1 Tax=Palaemon carinicauda TaxID=392227 RepID=UPI0035B6A4EE
MAVISCPVPSSNSTGVDDVESAANLFEAEEEASRVEKRSVGAACGSVKNETLNETSVIECPWFPRPELESLGLTEEYSFRLAVGIFMIYSSIYFILSFCVIVGTLKRTPKLLNGWVVFTSMHMFLILADLLYTLAFTTLIHLCTSLALLVVVIYTWAVVKSFMYKLHDEKMSRPSFGNMEPFDETVDGIHMEPIPVQV